MLKIKNREKDDLKKVLILGNDGTYKSSYAKIYCEQNNLKPVVIDVDGTNYTDLDIVDISFGSNDKTTVRAILNIIKEVESSEYDTLILDGCSSLLELLVSNASGLRAFGDRANNWKTIHNALNASKLNIIFIAQADFIIKDNSDELPNKSIIRINSSVNEKYLCSKKGDEFIVECTKYRGVSGENKMGDKQKFMVR